MHRVSLTTMVEQADPVARGTLRGDLWLGFSNIFEQDSTAQHLVYFDMERLITTTGVRYGVTDRLEVGGRLTFETTGPGFLDNFVSWWHTKLNLGNANRERFPANDYRQRLEGPGEQVLFDIPSRTLGLEDIRLFAKWKAAESEDGRRVLSLRSSVRLPTRSDLLASPERADVSLTALGRLSWDRWHLHGMLGASTVRAARELGTLLRDRSYFIMLGAERSFGESWGAVVQYSVATPVLQSFRHRELDWASANVVFGVAGRFGPAWRWDVSFQEDIPPDSPAVDFTLGFRLSRTWP